jgi:ABC-type transporter Mla subunit MlaD
VTPNVMPTAASATASGSSRNRLRKTISSAAAITSTAATSRPAIEPVISDARSLVTTGTPLTVYVPP